MFKIKIQLIVHIIRSGSGNTFIARLSFNSCAASWDKRTKRVQNADNGGNERQSLEIAQKTPRIQRRNFWCDTNVSIFFLVESCTGSGPEMIIF